MGDRARRSRLARQVGSRPSPGQWKVQAILHPLKTHAWCQYMHYASGRTQKATERRGERERRRRRRLVVRSQTDYLSPFSESFKKNGQFPQSAGEWNHSPAVAFRVARAVLAVLAFVFLWRGNAALRCWAGLWASGATT